MPSILDDRGYNQGFKPSKALEVRTDQRLAAILSQFPEDGVRVLEIGCGTGMLSYLLAKQRKQDTVIATDICVEFLEQARKDYKLKNLSYEYLDFNDKKAVAELIADGGKFDFVIGDGILHHLYQDINGTAASINSLLKDGGKMVFWEPNILNPYCFVIFTFPYFRAKANLEPDEMAFGKGFMKNVLRSNGFVDVSIRHGDFLLPVTPDSLVSVVQSTGKVLEKVPVVNRLTQSIFIVATKR